MSVKPTLVYYQVQDFQKKTLGYIDKLFTRISFPDPSRDMDDVLYKADVLIAPMGYFWGKEKLDRCANLKVIGTPTTGTVHIDLDYVKKKNISLCSFKDQQTFLSTITPTAELAWGLLIAVTRHLPSAYRDVCNGKWNGRKYGKQTPKMLSDMSLGIIGLGRLGSWVARYANAFRMQVNYYDPYVENNQYTRCFDPFTLARVSDVVSVHAHLTDETKGLIDRKFIKSMKKGSYLINTARGEIVNEADLLEALKEGHLAGAGLDLLAGEHLPNFKNNIKDHTLIHYARSHKNLIITPKLGGCTVDAWEETEMHLVDLIIGELIRRRNQ